jgi:K+-transporting ATPase KdpF subunit
MTLNIGNDMQTVLTIILTLMLLAYLVYSLLYPEKF